jgi:DNA-binding MarR family transcriptional regulator
LYSKEATLRLSLEIPDSGIIVLQCLTKNGPMSPGQISIKEKLPLRTVSYALRKLLEWNLLRRIPNLHDMRKPLYDINTEKVKALKNGQDTLIKTPQSLLSLIKTS